MAKKLILIIVILMVVLSLGGSGCFAHDYDKKTSDHPGRYLAYAAHPFGFAAEWLLVRPAHWLVSLPGINKATGHTVYDTDSYFGEKHAAKAGKKSAKPEKQKLADVQKQEQQKSKEVDELKKTIEQKESETSTLGQENANKTKEIEDLKVQLTQKEKELADLRTQLDQKDKDVNSMKEELEKLKVQMSDSGKAFTFTLLDGVLFEQGSDKLSAKGKESLAGIATAIKQKFADREVVIQGHTDNQPIAKSGWKSNWELGAARSLAVLHYMVEEAQIPAAQISAATCGEFRPVADNATPEGKASNRKSIILVLPKDIKVEKLSAEQK